MSINVYSEVKQLKKVLLHRPGKEILNLTPDALKELLFDEIPDYQKAREEHDAFAQIFRDNGVEVIYLEDLVIETLDANPQIKDKFLSVYLDEAEIEPGYYDISEEYFQKLDNKELIRMTMAGLTRYDLETAGYSMTDFRGDYVIYPMPNLYFTRDSFATIGNGVSINHMYSDTRNRETIYGDLIFKYHPEYHASQDFFGRKNKHNIEGGDILVVNDELLLIGDSQRTEDKAIEILANNILGSDSGFLTILQLTIEDSRAFMHLDTVLTQLDEDSFVIFEPVMENIKIKELTRNNGHVKTKRLHGDLKDILAHYMKKEHINFYKCGGENSIDAKREQWTDGANVVTIRPGKVIAYKRNFVTNQILRAAGYEVIELDSSNLTMGRGGPRCMSMPLERE